MAGNAAASSLSGSAAETNAAASRLSNQAALQTSLPTIPSLANGAISQSDLCYMAAAQKQQQEKQKQQEEGAQQHEEGEGVEGEGGEEGGEEKQQQQWHCPRTGCDQLLSGRAVLKRHLLTHDGARPHR